MKKLLFLLLISAFLFGCGTAAKQSELWQHDTMYKNGDHMTFSIWGYRNTTAEKQKRSVEQGWWGIEIPYIPAE
ncbi:MAG TPA: hypothetical protein VMW42_03975 [Desulfatiglandales bacterium]|nr:hypothetical protein [Desulfatiglandales bacterium]